MIASTWCYQLILLGLALSLGLVTPANAQIKDQVTVHLLGKAQVRKSEVLLSDVAEVHSNSLPVQLLVGNIPLGRIRTSGHSMQLQQETLMHWVKQQSGLQDDQLKWSGAKVVELFLQERILSNSDIVKEANNELERWLLERSTRVQVEVVTSMGDILVPHDGEILIKTRPINQKIPRKMMVVWVDIFCSSRLLKSVPVKFNVAAWSLAGVSTRNISRGEQLASNSIEWREVNVAKLPDPSIADEAFVLHSKVRFKRDVSIGEVLTYGHFESVPAIARGDWAMLQGGAGAVILQTRVQLPHDVKVGQSVRVKPSYSSSHVWAKVKGPNLLELMH